ncbi:PilN domain-containing protein [Patescibacteria group bacterium]|nr:PilN domain-containing protein [Patescibacteria group bacterium]
MDPQATTSFIPKKPLIGESRRGSTFGLLMLACILIFIMSLVAAGATFLYEQYLKSAIISKSNSLSVSQNAFDQGVIQDLVRTDSLIRQSKTLLATHVAPSAIFDLLSNQTLEKVQFNKFEYSVGDSGVAIIHLDGSADSFSTIALQSDQFGASKVLKDTVFSNINISTETGRVTFSISAGVDPSLTLYSRTVAQTSSAPGATTSSTQL